MGVAYRRADDEVKALAAEIIAAHHPHLQRHGVRVEYVFRSETARLRGRDIWGVCRKVTSLNAYLGGGAIDQYEGTCPPFFVIELAEPVWEEISPKARRALLDHELSHAWAEPNDEGEVCLSVLPHDLEEFRAVVDRHGLWRAAVEEFTAAAARHLEQPALPFERDPQLAAIETRLQGDLHALGLRVKVRLEPESDAPIPETFGTVSGMVNGVPMLRLVGVEAA